MVSLEKESYRALYHSVCSSDTPYGILLVFENGSLNIFHLLYFSDDKDGLFKYVYLICGIRRAVMF